MSKSVEDLLVAFDEWREAKGELKRCYATCEHSAGYHCYPLARREEEARKVVADTLDSIIDARIAEALVAQSA